MKIIKFAGMLMLVAFLIVSCSDDSSTNPETTKNYFPNTTGNYWIFNEYTLDFDNQKENPDIPTIDSAAITGTEVAFGKTLSKYDVFTLISDIYQKQQEMRLAYESGTFYMRSNYLNNMMKLDNLPIDLPLQLPDSILKIINTKSSAEFEVFSKTLKDIPISYGGINATVNGEFKITSKKSAEDVMTINGVSVKTFKYTLPISLTITIKAAIFPIPIPISFSTNYNLWIAENIGIVKTQLESKNLYVEDVVDYDYLGFQTELIRYNVAK
ncbi:MAG TPA: hypothetical protein PKY56_06575 [Candidatus Kapabacteria bacterium]|nr:hypothetical protein [Candidatus Kapabacteria bacterium]